MFSHVCQIRVGAQFRPKHATGSQISLPKLSEGRQDPISENAIWSNCPLVLLPRGDLKGAKNYRNLLASVGLGEQLGWWGGRQTGQDCVGWNWKIGSKHHIPSLGRIQFRAAGWTGGPCQQKPNSWSRAMTMRERYEWFQETVSVTSYIYWTNIIGNHLRVEA